MPVTQVPARSRFVFATGIECSYPVIDVGGQRVRRDQLAECRHYDRWQDDIALTREIGCTHLRYGLPWYRMHTGPGQYDWSFADQVLPALREAGIVPILDLCHFGVPDWLGNFQNPDLCRPFAEFARAVAERYPWIRLFTPINEMYITAEFSAFYGWWNERLASHQGFVRAVTNITLAASCAMRAILEVRPDALFVLAESSEYTHANHPDLVEEAELFNERRFLTLDLICGQRISASMFQYLRDNGMTDEEYRSLRANDFVEHLIVGHDYYITNEHLLVGPGIRHASGEIFGYDTIARGYHKRYRLPVMHTETNLNDDPPGSAEHWLWKSWANVQQLRREAVPICGMTWYSLTDQVDWDTALREQNHRVNPLGLYDLDRNIRPVGRAYKRLIEQWRHIPLLPYGPFSIVGGLDAAG